MKSIIVGTDFSAGSFVALEVAVDIAKALRTNIKLIWVQQERMLATDEDKSTLHRLAEDKLNELCNKYKDAMAPLQLSSAVLQGKIS